MARDVQSPSIKRDSKIVNASSTSSIVFVWLAGGVAGLHRFMDGKHLSGCVMLILATAHVMLICLTVPLASYEYLPQGFVLRTFGALLAPSTGILAVDTEVRMMRPLLLIMAAPSALLTLWWLVDGALLFRRLRKGI